MRVKVQDILAGDKLRFGDVVVTVQQTQALPRTDLIILVYEMLDGRSCQSDTFKFNSLLERVDPTFRVLLVDQFSGINPFWLQQQKGLSFDDLVQYTMSGDHGGYKRPQVLEVEETFSPPMCSTTFRAQQSGLAEVWKMKWDSSG